MVYRDGHLEVERSRDVEESHIFRGGYKPYLSNPVDGPSKGSFLVELTQKLLEGNVRGLTGIESQSAESEEVGSVPMSEWECTECTHKFFFLWVHTT